MLYPRKSNRPNVGKLAKKIAANVDIVLIASDCVNFELEHPACISCFKPVRIEIDTIAIKPFRKRWLDLSNVPEPPLQDSRTCSVAAYDFACF